MTVEPHATWAGGGAIVVAAANLAAAFDAVASEVASRPAIADEAAVVTYGELRRRSRELARMLCGVGAHGERLVAIHVERGPGRIAAILAALYAGVPWTPIEPSYPNAYKRELLDQADPVAILSDGTADHGWLGTRPIVDADAARVSSVDDFAPPGLTGSDAALAYVLYTSGSTGRPKGVAVEHRAVLSLVADFLRRFAITSEDRVLQYAPATFDVSVWEIFVGLLGGGTVCTPSAETARDPAKLTEHLRDQRVTIVEVVPHLLDILDPAELPDVRIAMSGMEVFPASVLQRWAATGREAFNGYGPTECTVTATVERFGEDWDHRPIIGRPISGVRAYVLDDRGCPVEPEQLGELYLAGACLARGYLAEGGLTAQRFLPDRFSPNPGERMYRTGDLVHRRHDGRLVFHRRVDEQLKVRGYRVEAGQVEACLQAHHDVRDAAVVAQPDPSGAHRLVAFVVTNTPVEPDLLREHCQRGLPSYMVPAVFALLPELPRAPSGKTDRSALSRRPVTETRDAPTSARPPAAHRDVVAAVARQWRLLLGVDAAGAHTFVGSGGDSLIAMKLVARLREELGIELSMADVITARTFAELCEVVASARPVESRSLIAIAQARHRRTRAFKEEC